MQTTNKRWDTERAAAWLKRHGWADSGELPAPPPAPAAACDSGSMLAEEIDVAGWPALVAPFYD